MTKNGLNCEIFQMSYESFGAKPSKIISQTGILIWPCVEQSLAELQIFRPLLLPPVQPMSESISRH